MMDDPDARFHWTQLDPESDTSPNVPKDMEEALEAALTLAVVALKEEQSKQCMEMAVRLASQMDPGVVEQIKEQAAFNARMLMRRHVEIFEQAEWAKDES